jgi:acetate---CoA ligase (ADP-forming)
MTSPASEALARVVRPRSVAVVGASPEPTSMGGGVVANLDRFGYAGEIHLVNRNRTEINGRPCVASVDQLPEGIDVVGILVPQAGIREAIAAAARRKAGAVIVYAAGFAEMGEVGREEQAELAALARAGGMRLMGPNGIGFVNYVDNIPLTFEPIPPAVPGLAPAVGIVAQSGAMETNMRVATIAKGLGVTYAFSTGNEADLGAEDFLDFLIDDAATRVIMAFAEQFRHPRRMLEAARRARAAGKPIVLMHPGRSARSRASALSHTGALAGDHDVMETLVRREAVALVETFEELVDAAELLVRFPRAPARGCSIITNSGAFKGYALDFAETIGLDLPLLTPNTAAEIKAVVPPFASVDNPLDVTAQTMRDPTILGRSATHLLADPAIGSLIAAMIVGNQHNALERMEHFLSLAATSEKPLVIAALGDEVPLPPGIVEAIRARGVPFYRSPERAMRAMAHVVRHARALESLAHKAPPAKLPEVAIPPGTSAEWRGKVVLRALGIAVPEGALAETVADARQIASRIGYPVVLKAQAADLPHKTEAGGVIVNIADAATLGAAWDRLHSNVKSARPDVALDGVLVEKMGVPGLEMVVGARRDPNWGPVVLVGLGGVWIEALGDVRLLPTDLTQAQIAAELHQLKGAKLLAGMRGAPKADVEALAEVAATLSALMVAHPEIAEIDINPLVVYPQGAVALDVLIVAES